MLCLKSYNKYNNKCKALIAFCTLLCFCITQSITAQKTDFNTELETTIKSRPLKYKTLDSIFSSFERDSTKMKALANKAKSINYIDAESYALNALGNIYRNVSLYEKAIETHKEAEALARKINNIELQIITLNMIGVDYRRLDLVKPALDYHTKALDIAKSIKTPSSDIKYSIAVSQNSMGNIYLVLEQYALAITQFNKSLVIEKESGNLLGLAINYQNIGFAYEAQGDLDLALKNYRRSLDYNTQINSDIGKVICYNSIGQIYIKQKNYSDAKTMIEKALKKALMLKDQFYIASSHINLGWVQNELNLDEDAETNLKKGLEIGETYNLKSSVVEAKKHLSDFYSKKGKHELALLNYQNAITLEKTINNQRNLRYVNDVIIQFENEAKNKQIKELASENEVVKSKLERNKKIFWYSMLALTIIGGIIVALYRNRQLKQEKQILTLEQDMLRSQMNPHFIFNSLNSIKLYIINNEKENAVYYLNKFSKLIRKILVASTEKEISLEDELDTMQLYMNIENIRFSNEIDFKISVDKGINTSNIKVPTLILQPFIENALWHGLSSKKGDDKKIRLHVYKTAEDYITISVTDNGIGRKQSEKINRDKLLKRKSVGIAITRARLANFSKSYTSDYTIDVKDLYDKNNDAIGTKVIVNIPVTSNF
ncbi:tetratricopeptide repeat-containing sensor histidine kinase [Ichthyenterobacterium magnum]|uniref:Tetratricopeptide repeat protein n=1 Tax=Ichthyenterobacterium magnum TaxID=1230530 RepID=A0A420DXT8_9FLAO|nr:tetratricopeptide repeat protein [Ichthyenterobacterium magnum]RKE99017.1 tetratricopeptide repeat protein [Ichthyenterobacterium magnum]